MIVAIPVVIINLFKSHQMITRFTYLFSLLSFLFIESMSAQVVIDISSPAVLAGKIQASYAEFGPIVTDIPATGELIYLDGVNQFGCTTVSLDLTGKIAIIDRGTCDFSVKAYHAQLAGAVGVILAYEAGRTLTFPLPAGDTADLVTIPMVGLLDTDYDAILQALTTETVSASIYNYDAFSDATAVYSEDFANGLNGWTSSNPTAPDSAWTWEPNGESKATVFFMNSPTAQSNGSATFDASWYNQAFLGQPLPYPFYTASLTSPSIDVSDHEYLYLTFYQSNWQLNQRNFPIPQTFLEYSIDDGNAWSPIIEVETQNDLTNQSSNYPHSESVSILLEDLQFTENLRIRFTYDGDFYFWALDDIKLTIPPDDELAIENTFYPLIHYATPEQHISTDIMGFQTQVFNGGLNDQLNNEVKVQVINESLEVFHEQSRLINLSAFSRDTIIFDNWAPILPAGNYQLRYSFMNDAITDAFPENNVQSNPFVITTNTFAQELADQADILQSYTNAAVPYYFGSTFTISPAAIAPCLYLGVDIALNASDGILDTETVTLYLLKWTDDNDGYPNYVTELNMAGFSPIDHPNFEIVAVRFVEPDGIGQNEIFSLDLIDGEWIDETGSPIITLDLEAATYALVGEFEGNAVGFAGFNSENLAGVPSILYNAGNGDTWSPGIVDNFFPIMRHHVDCIEATNATELSDAEVRVYPTLADEEFSVEFDLDNKSEVTIALLDMQGRVVAFDQLTEVVGRTYSQKIADIPAGFYLLDIQTSNGIKQEKITIMH